jgi:hypothetical protein
MKRLKYILFTIVAAILLVPLCIIAFILAGIDAIIGIGLYDTFYNFIECVKLKVLQ